MTRDDVIRMARECFADPDGSLELLTPELTQFAALVAAAERKQCAEEVEACTSSDGSEQYHIGIMTAVAAIRARDAT